LDEVSILVNDWVTVNNHPCVSDDPMIQASETHDEGWRGTSTREHAIQQQAALKAAAIMQAG
jgi:hypothetical protein